LKPLGTVIIMLRSRIYSRKHHLRFVQRKNTSFSEQNHSIVITLAQLFCAMIKLNLTFVGALLATVIISSCSDDDRKPAEKTFLAEYLKQSGLSPKDTVSDWETFECGLFFKVLVPGTIEKIRVRIPDDETDLRVTIWDAEAVTILKTIIIPSVEAHKITNHTIEPLALETDHTYGITMNTNDWYRYEREDGSVVSYPVVSDNIRISTYLYEEGTGQFMPIAVGTTFYAGDLSFVFEEEKD